MHAVEKYEGVLEKLRESSTELDNMKDAAREVTVAFDAIKKRRQQLFQVSSLLFIQCVIHCVVVVSMCRSLVQNVNFFAPVVVFGNVKGLFPSCVRSPSRHLQRPYEELQASIGLVSKKDFIYQVLYTVRIHIKNTLYFRCF